MNQEVPSTWPVSSNSKKINKKKHIPLSWYLSDRFFKWTTGFLIIFLSYLIYILYFYSFFLGFCCSTTLKAANEPVSVFILRINVLFFLRIDWNSWKDLPSSVTTFYIIWRRARLLAIYINSIKCGLFHSIRFTFRSHWMCGKWKELRNKNEG